MVVVTKSNFVEQSNDFLDHLPSAAFVAVDEEMTGISVGNQRPPKDETPSQRYPDLKKAPETYSIIQLGVSLFHYTGDGKSPSPPVIRNPSEASPAAVPNREDPDWTVRKYNFFAFPGKDSERSVVLNPSAVAFLHQHNISFDKWTKEGVPYLLEDQAEKAVKQYTDRVLEAEAKEQQESKQPTVQEASQRRVQLRRTEDVDFFTRAMATLRNWLDTPVSATAAILNNQNPDNQNEAKNPPEGACFMLPECNSFMRRALYESIGQEYPSLILEKVPGANRIQVWRLSDAEKEQRQQRLRKEAWSDLIVERVGLFRIFFALSQVCRGFELERDSPMLASSLADVDFHKEPTLYRGARNRKVPIIVHNGFMDLCFLQTHFVSHKLPDSLAECKAAIRKYFPVIYDTKILAAECSPIHFNDNTRLGALFARVSSHLEGRVQVIRPPPPPPGESASAGSDPSITSEEHFADYDAYMTGICYLGICQCIHRMSEYPGRSGGVAVKPTVGTLTHLLEPIDDPEVRKAFGRNLLYQMSMFNLDLEISGVNDDPLCRGMNKNASYRVANTPQSTNTRDIINCLSRQMDRTGRPVVFEIVWIDDTSFIVAASYRPNGTHNNRQQNGSGDEVLMEHGRIIHNALKDRFPNSNISSMAQYLEEQEKKRLAAAAETPSEPSVVSRMLNWIGINVGSSSQQGTEGPATKKRRLD